MTTPINALPYPNSASPNAPYTHFANLAGQIDSRLVARFATVTARDAAITSPVNGMMCWIDTPAGWYQRVNGAWRFTPGTIPNISGTLRRTDHTDVVNVGAPPATSDTGLETVATATEGTWTTFVNSLGVGLACSVPGWYVVEALLPTDVNAPRYENLRITGTAAAILGGGQQSAGFGDPGGSVRIKCPSGISVVFTYQQNGSVAGTIRAGSRFAVTWASPITS